MRACALIPAFDAEATVARVVTAAVPLFADSGAVLVVDDGSRDATAAEARRAGAHVLVHERNRGKGAALRTGLREALARGFDVAVSIDADGQHPPVEGARLLAVDADPSALVLGVRDLVAAGAPRANQISNGISNFFLSLFSRRALADTQCGLRRYPIAGTLALGGEDDGYAFEAEIILRAVAAGVRIVEEPVRVVYPPAGERVSHFDSVRDPARIVARVVRTLVTRRSDARAPLAGSGPQPIARRERASTPVDGVATRPPPSAP
ncbi:MAG TPA: glycosyltransferase family 2 protein [Byssovorax sp.]|jgi:glycosyltransferase involved in cell wall biosynthesis